MGSQFVASTAHSGSDFTTFEAQFHAGYPPGLARTARVQDVINGKNTWRVGA